MKTKSASETIAATRARYPQCLPMTSMINVRRWDDAVVSMQSTASMIRCKAESVPMVMSVPQKSLSMDPTIPTMFKWAFLLSCSSVIKFSSLSVLIRSIHSSRKQLAPVSDPSPPMTTKFVIDFSTKFLAAWSLPSLVLNSRHRADPIMVPPLLMMPETEDQSASSIFVPPSTKPWYPSLMKKTLKPWCIPSLTTALTAEFIPWASPPLVRMAMDFPTWVSGGVNSSSSWSVISQSELQMFTQSNQTFIRNRYVLSFQKEKILSKESYQPTSYDWMSEKTSRFEIFPPQRKLCLSFF